MGGVIGGRITATTDNQGDKYTVSGRLGGGKFGISYNRTWEGPAPSQRGKDSGFNLTGGGAIFFGVGGGYYSNPTRDVTDVGVGAPQPDPFYSSGGSPAGSQSPDVGSPDTGNASPSADSYNDGYTLPDDNFGGSLPLQELPSNTSTERWRGAATLRTGR